MIASDSGRPEGDAATADRETASKLARRLDSGQPSGPLRIDLLFAGLDAADEDRIDEIVGDAEHSVGADPRLPLEPRTHRVAFGLDEIDGLYRLYGFVADRLSPDRIVVLVDDRRVPRATELWLPLLWTLLP